MGLRSRGFILALLFIMAPVAQARIFSYEANTVAAYFRAATGMVSSGDQYFASSSGASTTFNREVDYTYAGELGFKFPLGPNMDARVGVEFMQTKDITVNGLDSGGTPLMSVESSAFVLNPSLTFEFKFSNQGMFRKSFFIGGGYGSATLTNTYTLTTPGTSAYPGADSSYKEAVDGTGLTGHAGVAGEFLLVDNVGLVFEVGYKYANFSELKYKNAVNGVNGAKAEGEAAKTNAGEARSFDMSGAFIGMAFRFYIPPL